ncbi:NCS1 nucleoside transporter family [Mrakia frigida]|uniref:nucleobase cation symporter-1 family protein n=1 Tax=Mrakia frigida TaxID=29902 RepID=UPI003FCC16DA
MSLRSRFQQTKDLVEKGFDKLTVPGPCDPYINDDIIPLPPHRRTWTQTTFNFFWLATSINIGGLTGSASILSLGLSVPQAVACDVIGSVIICAALVANGCQGGKWHIPFAVGNRAGWGVRGSWFVVANRLILSFCWYGVQTWWGGQVTKNMIGAIWPQFYRMRNHFPASANMETNDFIAFVIFWTISLPLLAIRPERYRIPALISSIAVTISVIALLVWALAKEGGGGPLFYDTHKTTGVAALKGSKLAWTMARGVTTTIGGWAGGIMYQSDFSRYARRSGDQIMGQIFIIPVCLILGSFIGVVVTSCAAGFYPDEGLLWRPYKLMEVIQEKENSSGARAAMFFLAFSFFLSQLCVNIAGNAITGGIDLASMFPKYVNTRRGPFIVAVVGFAMNPWQLVNTANTFISVLSGYSIFLGPLAGIMIADYFVVRRQNLRLSHLYIANTSSIYWFWHGLNPKALVVWALAVFPSLPGWISVLSKGKISMAQGWVLTSYLAWPLGFAIASTLWVAINRIFPPPGLGEVDETDVFGTFDEVGDPLDTEKAGRDDEEEDKKISKPQSEKGVEGNYIVER